MMRELLGSWQSFALEHSHTLPDGFLSKVPVLQKMKAKIEIDELDHATLTYIYEDNIGTETGLSVAANGTHGVDAFLVRETVRRCNYDLEQLVEVRQLLAKHHGIQYAAIGCPTPAIVQTTIDHNFVSLRGVEFINENNINQFPKEYRCELMELIDEVLAKPSFKVLTIHDEFKCLPNYVNHMRLVYQQILAELADSRVGEQMIQELRNDPSYVLTKLSTDLGAEILKSEYFLS